MLKTNALKIKITGFIVALQAFESLLVLAELYGVINKIVFINNSSIKFMLSFIIFSPELCLALMTINYLLREEFKILHHLIITTKIFQIAMGVMLFVLGYSLRLYVYQISLFHLLGIIIIYATFNSVILVLIKVRNRITE
ncbi:MULTISPECIES: hypothetical protein [unclassified Borrelia]|uniref:hypothetical protein n=1 Tax=unclassified Borrelia TaxID=2649934 RepID=UPI001E621DB8|nr:MULTISPECIES: hypothetical protein [unclassified Borrelia]UGQ16046.1 hypothetical protein LSO06_01825 [Borrelia sp. RT5S]UGQ17158.1 hypothetical protein LSO05_01820 [Borrelia sp. RT1S]